MKPLKSTKDFLFNFVKRIFCKHDFSKPETYYELGRNYYRYRCTKCNKIHKP